MENNILVQNISSRSESLRQKLSALVYQRGIDSFFTEHIPFSYSCGYENAIRFINVIKLIAAKKEKNESIIITEIAAGSGLFCFRILDLIYELKLPFAENVYFNITDFSEKNMIEIKNTTFYKKYHNQVSLLTFNIFEDNFTKLPKSDSFIMNYILDSLPHKHYQYKDKKIVEKKIKTYVDKNQLIIDTTTEFPEIIKNEKIKNYIESTISEKNQKKLSKLKINFIETFHNIKVSEKDLESTDLKMLKKFCLFLNNKEFTFNYSTLTYPIIKELYSRLTEDGFIFIFDFGLNTIKQNINTEKLTTNYGLAQCHSFNFPYLKFISKELNLSYFQTNHKKQENQHAILSKAKLSEKKLKQIFKEKKAHLTDAKRISKYKSIGKKCSFHINQRYKKLIPQKRKDFTLLKTIISKLIEVKEFDEALNYIKIAKKEYESYAIAFSCQEAELYRTKNEHLKTVSIIKPELKMHPTLANMHYLYCVSLSFLDDKKTFIKQFKDYLDYCDNILPWRYFIILACYYFELGHHQKGKEILTYIIKIQKDYPELAIQHKLAMKKNDQENYIYDIDMFVDLIEDCHQILNQFEKITS